MTIIEKVALAIKFNDFCSGYYWSEEDQIHYMSGAKAAIEAMRDLVKCDPNGNREEDLIINRYIDAALKE